RQLMGFGVAANDVLPLLKSVNMAVVAIGAGAPEMQRIVQALGQMQARGKVTARELMRLALVGVPVNKILQRELGLTGDEVAEIVLHGVKAQRALEAIARGWRKQYGSAYQDARQTFNFQLSNLRKDFDHIVPTTTE